MAAVDGYKAGTPSWVDLSTSDVQGAIAFYEALFGWETERLSEEAGGYVLFRRDGRQVAGAGPIQGGGPPAWATHIASDDVSATASRVREAGGTVVMEPMDVLDAGRLAGFLDPNGAFFCAWQAGNHHGAEIVHEANTFTWAELNTRDTEGAAGFYSQVFGWDPHRHEGGPMPYTEWHLGGRSIGGMVDMEPAIPQEVPPHWLNYFAVENTQDAVARIKELGGSVTVGPIDSPAGEFAVVRDPQGATFAVIALKDHSDKQ